MLGASSACHLPPLFLIEAIFILIGTELVKRYFLVVPLPYLVSVYFAATQVPDLPPLFSSSLTSPITMPRSTALHIS
jgi:hypothetical protein